MCNKRSTATDTLSVAGSNSQLLQLFELGLMDQGGKFGSGRRDTNVLFLFKYIHLSFYELYAFLSCTGRCSHHTDCCF